MSCYSLDNIFTINGGYSVLFKYNNNMVTIKKFGLFNNLAYCCRVRRTFFISIKEKVEIFHNDPTINRRSGTKSGSSNPQSTDVQESRAKAKNKTLVMV